MSESNRDVALRTEILNSSDKRMKQGQEPGPIKTKHEIKRTAARKNVKSEPKTQPNKKVQTK